MISLQAHLCATRCQIDNNVLQLLVDAKLEEHKLKKSLERAVANMPTGSVRNLSKPSVYRLKQIESQDDLVHF